jgi:hypothetical protein
MAIPFTDREMEKAWRENLLASDNTQRTNAHRLLLFYAVECGLKAVLMRRQNKKRSDLCIEIAQYQHDVNKLLECLSAKSDLKLPAQINMKSIKTGNVYDERKFTPGDINQMWRYGGSCSLKDVTDQYLESKLLEIVKWIKVELGIL